MCVFAKFAYMNLIWVLEEIFCLMERNGCRKIGKYSN